MARIRLYHALCWSKENEETTRLLREDPWTQIVIATIAFGQGINVKTLLDSIQLSFPVSLDQEQQQRGHVGRDLTTPAHGILLFQPSAAVAAEKYLKCKLPDGF